MSEPTAFAAPLPEPRRPSVMNRIVAGALAQPLLIALVTVILIGIGIWSVQRLPVDAYPEAAWDKAIALNLTSVFLTSQAVLPAMRARGYGRIVHIASIAGKEGNVNLAPYSAAKAGVIAFTKVLARELAETEIRVNAVTPGLFRTAILDEMSEEAIQWSLDRIPMKRAGRLDEIGAMVAWLVSEECSFSTGAVFDISGGRATY